MMKVKLTTYLSKLGLLLGAITPEVDSLDSIPEFLRPAYQQDPATKKFRVDLSKVDVEDVTGLKNAVQATRKEANETKAEADRRIAEIQKQFEGIDPVKTRELLSQFASEEERRMIAAGHIDKVMENRTQKLREELERQASTFEEERDGALEVASTLMENAIDNQVRAVAASAGVHPGAVEDALLRARQIFSLDDDLHAVQFEEDGETPILNKEGKIFSVEDWIEERRLDCPHWFAATDTGTGATGSKRKVTGAPNLEGLSPQARMTAFREAQAAQGGGGRKS